MTVLETGKGCYRYVSVGKTISYFIIGACTFKQNGIDVESFFFDVFPHIRQPCGYHQWGLVRGIGTDVVIGTVELAAVQ